MKQTGNSNSAFSLLELSISLAVVSALIVVIFQSNLLIRSSKVAYARSLTDNSIVNNTENLVVWLDTVSTRSFDTTNYKKIKDTTVISKWYDIGYADNKNNAVASTGAVFYNDIINSLPALKFNGSNSSYSITTKYTNLIQPRTVFLVMRPVSNSSTHYLYDNSNCSPAHFLTINSENKLNLNAGIELQSASDSVVVGKNYIVTALSNDTSSKIRVNGIEVSGGIGTSSFTPTIYLGAGCGPASFFDGYIGEFIIFDRALTSSEITNIEKYLSKKWSIKIT